MAKNRKRKMAESITVIQTNWQLDEELIKSVRMPVFVQEQQVPYEIDFDNNDALAVHWLAYGKKNVPVGTARLLKDGHFGRMAVIKMYRSQGIGRSIIQAAMDHAGSVGMESIYLNSQLQAKSFYEGLGFQEYGDVFFEANIAHISMIKKLQLI